MPGGDLEVEHVVVAAPGTVPVLAEGAEVRVVLDAHREPEAALQALGGMDVVPAREDRRGADRLGGRVDRSRQPHADGEHARRFDAGRVEDRPDQGRRAVERVVGARIHVDVGAAFGVGLRVQVGDRHADVAVAEVDAHHGRRQRGRGAAGWPCGRGLRPARSAGSSRSAPSATQSATSALIVARESPVRRASSARSAGPARRTLSRIRRRLTSRSSLSDAMTNDGRGRPAHGRAPASDGLSGGRDRLYHSPKPRSNNGWAESSGTSESCASTAASEDGSSNGSRPPGRRSPNSVSSSTSSETP